ncbi:MAG TPA: hypothetical protein PLD62_06255 [Candidatus Cloacimonadota bacterium]|nr:hypothetical protein [Candidatus Cloacimonadota bacterium]
MRNRNYRFRNRRNSNASVGSSLFSTIITVIVGIAAKDLVNENSKVKAFIKNVFSPKRIEEPSPKAVIEGKYTIMDENPKIEK